MKTQNEEQSVLTLAIPPQHSLEALKKAVAKHPGLRLLAGGTEDEPLFVVEKKVDYYMARDFSMEALYQITGGLQSVGRTATRLSYAVSEQGSAPVVQAAVHISLMLIGVFGGIAIAFIPGSAAIGLLLAGVMLVIAIAYGVNAYRRHQGHLRELNLFIEDFARQTVPEINKWM